MYGVHKLQKLQKNTVQLRYTLFAIFTTAIAFKIFLALVEVENNEIDCENFWRNMTCFWSAAVCFYWLVPN